MFWLSLVETMRLRGYPINKIKSNLLKIIEASVLAKANPIIMQIRIPPNYGKNYVAAFEEYLFGNS